jgi:tetratricopeptide (TPR) repeat protein
VKRIAGVLFLSSFLFVGGVFAQAKLDPAKRAQAKEKFLIADKEYKAGRYGNALESYYESFSLSGEPLLVYNMAQCYRNLGRYEEALETYKDFLVRAPETPFTPKAEKWITELSAKVKPTKAEVTPDPTPSSQPESTPTTQLATTNPTKEVLLPPDTTALQRDQLRLELSDEDRGLTKARKLYKIGGAWIGGGLALGGLTITTIVINNNKQENNVGLTAEQIREARQRSFLLGLAADATIVVGAIYVQKAFKLASKEKPAKIEFASLPGGGEATLSFVW